MTAWQIRRYTIVEGQLEQFCQEWREKLVPLRERIGFTVEGAWTSSEESTLTWIVSYDGPKTFDEAFAEFKTSPERTSMDPNPARLMVSSESWMVEPASHKS